MPGRSVAELRRHLRSWAAELNERAPEPPVLVHDICKYLGVQIAKKRDVPKFKAYLSIDPSKDQPALILLPLKSIGNFERFCVAHELGHYLIFAAFSMTPQGKSEYWKHEELCDDFARHLLLPTGYLSAKLVGEVDADAYLAMCGSVAKIARVPWIQVAHRIAELRANVTYLRCKKAFSSDFRFVATTHPRRKGRGKVIKSQTVLWRALEALWNRSKEMNCCIRSDLTDVILESGASEALGVVQGTTVIAEAQTGEFSDIRMVAHSDHEHTDRIA